MLLKAVVGVAFVALGSMLVGCGPIAPPADPWASPACWDTSEDSFTDLTLTGPADTLGNVAERIVPAVGNCTSPLSGYTYTAVRAADIDEAMAKCADLNAFPVFVLTQASNRYVGAPVDAWLC